MITNITFILLGCLDVNTVELELYEPLLGLFEDVMKMPVPLFTLDKSDPEPQVILE